MEKQIAFILPEIDREKTKDAVEEAFSIFRFYLGTSPEEKLPKMTATYSLLPPSNTNQFNSSTENAVIGKVDFEAARDEFIERMRKAVNRLNFKEREAIILKYFGEEESFDYEVYTKLGMSESYYYNKFKPRIFYKLAFLLKLEVYSSEGNQTEIEKKIN